MKILLLLLVSFTLLTSTALARLGETPEQLGKRFGAPAQYKPDAQVSYQGHLYTFGQILTYTSEGWTVTCTIVHGTCERINYMKSGDFTEDQTTTILNNEAQGSKWTESTSSGSIVDNLLAAALPAREWKRADGAVASKSGNSMTLTTPDYDKAVDAAKQQGSTGTQSVPGNL